jgi:hypothetical protein
LSAQTGDSTPAHASSSAFSSNAFIEGEFEGKSAKAAGFQYTPVASIAVKLAKRGHFELSAETQELLNRHAQFLRIKSRQRSWPGVCQTNLGLLGFLCGSRCRGCSERCSALPAEFGGGGVLETA